jgi:hypothetical protein
VEQSPVDKQHATIQAAGYLKQYVVHHKQAKLLVYVSICRANDRQQNADCAKHHCLVSKRYVVPQSEEASDEYQVCDHVRKEHYSHNVVESE